jgi:penicillin-binding protein 2
MNSWRQKKYGEDDEALPLEDGRTEDSRLELPIRSASLGVPLFIMTVALAIFSFQLFTLQIIEGHAYRKLAENNRLNHIPIHAERGILHDHRGERIAWNEQPNERKAHADRIYTDIPGLGHVLGYARPPARDGHGFYFRDSFEGVFGAERKFDALLQGDNGRKIVETDVRGEVISQSIIHPAQQGRNVTLTLDAELNGKLHESMRSIIEEFGYSGGASVIMDVRTGGVRAMTSFPEIDPNVLFRGDDRETIESYRTDPRNFFLNRAVGGVYTPGSAIKPFIAVAALEEGIIDERTRILSTDRLVIPNPYFPELPSVFRDWRAHGLVDMRRAIAVSSNIYFYVIGGGHGNRRGLGIGKINEYSSLFGFGHPTRIGLDKEASGVVPNPVWKQERFEDGAWRLGDTYHTAIGQFGFLISPIQMARATAAIANDGMLLTPKIAEHMPVRKVRIDIDPHNFAVVREGMRLAVTEGTAIGLRYPDTAIAAKTGTAEVGAAKEFINSWLIGFFPYENPRYAFATVLERGPRENLIGGVAAMRRFFDWARTERPELFE